MILQKFTESIHFTTVIFGGDNHRLRSGQAAIAPLETAGQGPVKDAGQLSFELVR